MPVDVGLLEAPAGHALLVCGSEPQSSATLTAWVATGLRGGEKVLCAGMTPYEFASLLDRVGEPRHGVALADALSAGQLRLAPAEELFPTDDHESVVVAALGEGWAGVRVTGPAGQALARMSPVEYDSLEGTIDALCSRYPLSALCRCDSQFVRMNLALALAHHSAVAEDTAVLSVRRGRSGPGAEVELNLAGELDASNADLLRELVAQAAARSGPAPLTLDLEAVAFLSVGSVRALLAATDELRGGGGLVRVRGAGPHVLRVLQLLGVEQLPGFKVEEGEP
jgi:anti-anti-sigma factor